MKRSLWDILIFGSALFVGSLIPFAVAHALDVPGAIDHATSVISGPGWVALAATLAVVSEFFFRLIPSPVALSWLLLVSNIFHALSALFLALNKWMDRWIPQIKK